MITKNIMDFLFVCLISLGFVGGLFCGLRKATKRFFAFTLSIILVLLLLQYIVNFVAEKAVLENEFNNLISSNFFVHFDLFSKEITSKQEIESLFDGIAAPSVLKNIVINICQISNEQGLVGEIVSKFLYKTLLAFIIAILLFFVFYISFGFIFSFIFRFKTKNRGLFFTKSLLGGFVGGVKNILLFFVILMVVSYLSNITGMVALQNVLESSAVAKIGESFIEKNISAFICGIY